MANEQNLTPFQHGNTFGKGGVKGRRFQSLLNDVLSGKSKIVVKEETGEVVIERTLTKAEAITAKWVENAMNGDQRAIESIADRVDGKPDETLNVKTDTVYIAPDQPDELPMESQAKDSLPLNP